MDDAPAVHLLSENYDRPTTIHPAGALTLETAMTTDEKMKLPIHVPQGRPLVRTKNPMRPEWLDTIKRPLLIVAHSGDQLRAFVNAWKFDQSEVERILIAGDLEGRSRANPLLILPGGRFENGTKQGGSLLGEFWPIDWWEPRGGITIDIPENAVRKPFEFTLEDNLAASTKVAIAQHRHLDSLNSR